MNTRKPTAVPGARYLARMDEVRALTAELQTALRELAAQTGDRQVRNRALRMSGALSVEQMHYLDHVSGALSILGMDVPPEYRAQRRP